MDFITAQAIINQIGDNLSNEQTRQMLRKISNIENKIPHQYRTIGTHRFIFAYILKTENLIQKRVYDSIYRYYMPNSQVWQSYISYYPSH